MNYTKLPKKALLLLATPVLFSLAVPAGKLFAQSQTETKIRLMAEGLRARDSGDLAAAKTNFEQLLVLAPNDVTVQRLLAGVNEAMASGSTSIPSTAVTAPVTSGDDLVEVVYDPTGRTAPASAPVVADESAPVAPVVEAVDEAGLLAKAEEARVKQLIKDAQSDAKAANRLAKDGDFDGASAQYGAAIRSLPVNTLTVGTIKDLQAAQNELLLRKSQALLKDGDTAGAQQALDAYIAATSPEGRAVRKQAERINETELNPPLRPIEEVSPEFVAEQKDIAILLAKGRSQYVAGDIDGAQETFRLIETISAENPESKYFLKRISDEKAKLGTLNREKTRSLMIDEVAKGWQRPGVFVEKPQDSRVQVRVGSDVLLAKMDSIIIPSVSFTGIELGRVVSTLSALSAEYDERSPESAKGVNLVLGNQLPGAAVPQVNITLRNMSLKRILDIITENVGYQYEVQPDLVLIKPSGTDVNLVNEQFAVSKSAITRMTGAGSSSASTPAASADPFAPAPAAGGGGGGGGGESEGIRRFLQAAGVPFDTVPGASLAYDGASILVTHTSRNIDRIRNILGRYNDVRQVEIEAKFMDVSEGALDELGISWTGSFSEAGNVYEFETGNRSLSGAFTSSSSVNGGSLSTVDPLGNIVTRNIPAGLPSLPGTVDIGGNAVPLAEMTAVFGDVSVVAQLRALARRQGSDLLSAPKVTVLSGSRATITVAQELRFPQSYGETESEVGTAGSGTTTGGSAGVTITPGTPEDFATRNVGVELSVTPTVEEDDYSISLELNPRVTEFEGFVEFGGSSVAISGGTTVIIPSGFYQPIFSVREINTRVTIWDGATLVMGGLTREEVRRVDDKVPVLGDIPFIGRAFRSKGEASQKRNLLVFVTANLVSPGGSLKKQALKGVAPSSMFQNPTVVTPGGSEARLRTEAE